MNEGYVKVIDKYLTSQQLPWLNAWIGIEKEVNGRGADPAAIVRAIVTASDFCIQAKISDIGTAVHVIGQPIGVVGKHQECVWTYHRGWLEEPIKYA